MANANVMVNNLVKTVSAILLVMCIADVVIVPFLIGNPRKPYDGIVWLAYFIQTVLVTVMAGRIFGWW